MSAVFTGVKVGLALAFLIGPVFLSLLQTGIESGYKKGFLMALGISLSDAFFAWLCFAGLIQFVSDETLKKPIGYAGGIILLLFGLYHLFFKARQKNSLQAQPADFRNRYNYLLKGFLINTFNPSVPLFWIGTISWVTIDVGYAGSRFYIFFAAMCLTALSADFLKVLLAHKLRRLISPALLKAMNIMLGVVLLVGGGRLIWSAWHA